MNMINFFIKPIRIIRNNWKKSVFFSVVSVYVTYRVNIKLEINKMMKSYCKEVMKYGDESIGPLEKVRHLTVILNSNSNGKRGKNLYYKYAEPLFNCAGIKISVIETEVEGQAKDLMEIMDNTDGVVIAGGDGTLHEAINGYLQRKENLINIPIGVIPIGRKNLLALKLFDINGKQWKKKSQLYQAQIIAESSIKIIKETQERIDVSQINSENLSQPIFALKEINLGVFQNFLQDVEKYWYLSETLKPYYLLIKNILFKYQPSLTIPYNVEIFYTDPCSGCSKCYKKFQHTNNRTVRSRWWQIFLPIFSQKNKPEDKSLNLKNIFNEKCDIWNRIEVKNLTNLSIQNSQRMNKLILTLHPIEKLNRLKLIQEIVKAYKGEDPDSSFIQQIEIKDVNIKLSPKPEMEKLNKEVKSNEDKVLQVTNNFKIDSKVYKSCDIEITVLPKKIVFYC